MNLLVFKQKIKQQAIVVLLTLAVNLLNAQANYIMKNNGSGTPVNTGMLFEYNGDYIGIGTVTPSARLHINQTSITPQPNYFAITKTAGYPTPVTTTYFMVNGDGKVGIGTASPSAPLQILSNTTWGSLNPAPSSGLQLRITNADGNDVVMISDKSYNASGTHKNAGMVNVFSNTTHDQGALTVVNSESNYVPLLVCGDGTIGMGYSFTPTPFAQLDIRKQNVYNYMLNVADYTNANNFLTVHNSGYVGIGYANSGNATLQVVTPSGATGTAGVVITGNAPNNRFLYVGSGSSPATGPTYLTVKNTGVGVGIDDLSIGSTLALKKVGSGDTQLDIYGTSSDQQEQSVGAIINIRNATGIVQHSVLDDNDHLVLSPGLHLSSINDRYLVIAGNEQVNNNINVLGTADIAGRVKIGNVTTPSSTNYMLYVEKGILAERFRCAVKSSGSWSDYVFDKNYKLMKLDELEKYVASNHHLPNIPSATEVCKNGIDLGEMDALLLAKIEELSLYLIELKKENDAIKKQLVKLKKQ